MNTLEGELVARDSQLWFHGKGGDWQVPQDCAQHLREPTGSQPVILGVRPEHVVVGKCDTGSMFEGIVESVEWLGPYSDIAIVLADRQRIYCRSHTCQVATGDKVRWSLAPHDAHFFEPNIDDHGDVTHYGRRLN